MRKLVGLLIVGMFATSFSSVPQCGSDAFLDKCAPALGNHTFIKTFKVDIEEKGKKPEVSYVFSKGSKYRVVICDENSEGKKLIVKLYDRNKKLIASNYLKSTNKVYPSLNYTCSATGVYYVESGFKGGKNGCGVLILGFTK